MMIWLIGKDYDDYTPRTRLIGYNRFALVPLNFTCKCPDKNELRAFASNALTSRYF